MKTDNALEITRTLASDQLGHVSAQQLTRAKVTRRMQEHLVAIGALLRRRRGVFALVGAPNNDDVELIIAVLAAGDGSFVTHWTAAWVFALVVPRLLDSTIRAGRPPLPLEVTVPYNRNPKPAGIRVHRSRAIRDTDFTIVRDIPTATAERVIADLSGSLSDHELGLLIDSALRNRVTTIHRIRRCSERLGISPGRSPKRVERVLMQRIPGTELVESPLEEFVYDAIVRFDLPRPTPQHWVEVNGMRYRIDQCYPRQLLAVEVQSVAWHGFASTLHDGCLRGNDVALAGFRLVQFDAQYTDWQIASTLASLLELPQPERPARELTFADWKRLHGV